MTRPGNDTHRSQDGRSPGSRQRRQQPGPGGRPGAPIGRSTLWDDGENRSSAPQPLKASWDPVDRAPRTPTRVRPARTGRRRSAVGWFFHRYGWRAYAIPVLIALTVLVILQVGKPPVSTAVTGVTSAITTVISGATTTMTVTEPSTVTKTSATTAATTAAAGVGGAQNTPTPTPSPTGSTAPDPNSAKFTNLTPAALPPGGAFVAKGKDTWHVVKGTTAPMGNGPTKFTFTIEVEDGIENAQADQEFAGLVDNTLADPRSWIGSGNYTLQRIDSGTPSFRISLTSQMTVRENNLCGWEIHYEASCYARDVLRVAINDARWTRGAVSFNGDLGSYRVYAINHEVGHALGYMHQPCATNGGLAPVMMQQSWSTANDDLAPLNPQLIPMDHKVCKFNPYPYPLGSAPAATTTAGATG